jgi:hypothetical protein
MPLAMTGDDITSRAEEVRQLLSDRLRIYGRSLEAQLPRARRVLPRAVIAEARYLAQSAALAGNPKLLRMIDNAKLARAHVIVVDHLKSIDPGYQRRTRILNTTGIVALNLLIIGAALVGVLVWRGFI